MDDYKMYEDSLKELGIYKETLSLDFKSTYNSDTSQKVEIVKFDSCDEMIAKMQRGFSDFNWKNKNYSGAESFMPGSKSSFHFGQLKTFEATLEALKNGIVLDSVLQEATAIQEKLMQTPEIEQLMLRAATFKRHRVFSEEGSELDIDRVLCGDPSHWSRMTRGRKNTLVRLGINLAGNCMEDEKLFNKLSATAGIVTDMLQRAGFAVELNACSSSFGSTNYKAHDVINVILKQAEESIDLQRIYSVGASGYFRCWIFQVYCNILTGRPDSGLGQTCTMPKAIKEHLGIDYMIDQAFVDGKSQLINIQAMFNEIISTR